MLRRIALSLLILLTMAPSVNAEDAQSLLHAVATGRCPPEGSSAEILHTDEYCASRSEDSLQRHQCNMEVIDWNTAARKYNTFVEECHRQGKSIKNNNQLLRIRAVPAPNNDDIENAKIRALIEEQKKKGKTDDASFRSGDEAVKRLLKEEEDERKAKAQVEALAAQVQKNKAKIRRQILREQSAAPVAAPKPGRSSDCSDPIWLQCMKGEGRCGPQGGVSRLAACCNDNWAAYGRYCPYP